jgi:hypothetical protein
VSFAAITLCVASQRVFIVVSVYFVIVLVRKLLDTPSYMTIRAFVLKFRWSRRGCEDADGQYPSKKRENSGETSVGVTDPETSR